MWKKIIQNNGSNITNTDAIVINFIDGKDYTVTVLQQDFTTLEQWRDKQLNQILDEF
jgi:hypothetical protein